MPAAAAPDAAPIVGTARDLVALLLGRPVVEPLDGDPEAIAAFARAFPGP